MLISSLSDLPLYHSDMLLVKVRAGAAPAIAAAEAGIVDNEGAPGLTSLAMYERAGMIKRLVPLARPAAARARESVAASAVMAGIATVSASLLEDAPGANAGVSIVELSPETSMAELQMALAHDAAIEFVSRVPARYLAVPDPSTESAAVPPVGAELWNLKKIGWAQARQRGMVSAAGVRIAVLDTGLDPDHPDLPPSLKYVHDYGSPGMGVSHRDIVGHGTHVTGTICALVNNQIGINGICESTPACYKIFGDDVKYLAAQQRYTFVVDPILYRAALADCLEERVQVVNLSIAGYGEPDPQERVLFQALMDRGCTVVAAMGNDSTSRPSYPAAIPGVVAVGATSYDDRRAPFSNTGGHIALSAPGVGIWSTLPTYPGHTGNFVTMTPQGMPSVGLPIARETHYAAWQGTSMAAPHVAAAAALLISHGGLSSSDDVRAHLVRAVDRVPSMGTQSFSPEYGTGRLNLQNVF